MGKLSPPTTGNSQPKSPRTSPNFQTKVVWDEAFVTTSQQRGGAGDRALRESEQGGCEGKGPGWVGRGGLHRGSREAQCHGRAARSSTWDEGRSWAGNRRLGMKVGPPAGPGLVRPARPPALPPGQPTPPRCPAASPAPAGARA